ncbi:hypothetical protein BDV12DRAFT_201312 [Aspergillus spectabilis]
MYILRIRALDCETDVHSLPYRNGPGNNVQNNPAATSAINFADMLDFPDLRGFLSVKLSPPQSPTPTAGDGPVQDKSKRIREQNQNAQRAYRERKEEYIKKLLKDIDELNRNHVHLSKSYEFLRQDALCLQDLVQDPKGQLEF